MSLLLRTFDGFLPFVRILSSGGAAKINRSPVRGSVRWRDFCLFAGGRRERKTVSFSACSPVRGPGRSGEGPVRRTNVVCLPGCLRLPWGCRPAEGPTAPVRARGRPCGAVRSPGGASDRRKGPVRVGRRVAGFFENPTDFRVKGARGPGPRAGRRRPPPPGFSISAMRAESRHPGFISNGDPEISTALPRRPQKTHS